MDTIEVKSFGLAAGSGKKETETIRRRYDRFSRFYDSVRESGKINGYRKAMMSPLRGKILEVGVGTGKNLKYYGENADVTAIDLSTGMLSRASLEKDRVANGRINLMEMDAERLSYPDGSFDYVVTTFSLCSIPHPVKALGEMRRVLKAEGKFMAIEHMLSGSRLLALNQHLLNPLTKLLFGVNVNRKTMENIRAAGFSVEREENLMLGDVFRSITASKSGRGSKGGADHGKVQMP